MTKIEMLDLDGNVTEVCDATAEADAVCEDGEIDPKRCHGDVYCWVAADGMVFEACKGHIELDSDCRFAS